MTSATLDPNTSPVKPVEDYPLPILEAHGDLRGLAIPDEAVDRVAELLLEHSDDFVRRTRHLLGPLDVVIQEAAHLDTGDPAAVQSFSIWRSIPKAKALALSHVVAELLFLGGHTGVAVALVDSQGKGLSFRMTSFDGDFVSREVLGLVPDPARVA